MADDVGDSNLANYSNLANSGTAVAGPGPTSVANKRAANVTTTVVGQDGTDSARVGACSNCRSRKIKCSGDRPVCRTCAKNGQQCDYPLHISRKRKDRESSSSKRDRDGGGVAKQDADPRRSISMSAPLGGGGRQPSGPAVPLNTASGPVNDFLPPYDFGIDPLLFQTQTDPAGVHIDNAWLENFLAYDFGGGDNLFGLGNGQPTTNTSGNGMPSSNPFPLQGQAPVQAASTSSSGLGEGGQSSKGKAKFRVPFFRFFGPTAIAPGYRQVIADVSAPPSPNHRPFGMSSMTSISPMDPAGEYPSADAVKHLLPLFHLHFSYFFPLLPPSVESYTDSPAHLINIICALAARYSLTYAGPTRSNGLALEESDNAAHTWASKAKEQVSQHLAISDDAMVQTLLMISWYEFGQDRDSGLWMYSGMSLRMGQDLGLDTVCADPAMSPMPDHSNRHRLAGSLLMQDAIMTIGTGRSGMYPTPSSSTSIPHFPTLESTGMIDPFHYLIKIFAIAYRVTQVLVQPDVINAGELLERAQSDLNEFNTSLPAELRFETSTFRNYAAISQGGAFVLIHLWFHTLIILAYQPTIIYSDLPSLDTEDLAPASKEISASSAKTILDIVVFAELIDPKAITQPWINYPMYTAGRTFLSQTLPTGTPIDNPADPAHSGKMHMAKIARTNFQKVVDVLGNLQTYWGGVRYIRSVLIQKGEGVAQLSLVGEDKDDVTVPDRLSEWIANASTKQNSDIMGLSFSGTMHSPTDSRLSVVYPSKGATGN